jgi:hypothetical protein
VVRCFEDDDIVHVSGKVRWVAALVTPLLGGHRGGVSELCTASLRQLTPMRRTHPGAQRMWCASHDGVHHTPHAQHITQLVTQRVTVTQVDPLDDIDVINLELALADLGQIEKRMERLQKGERQGGLEWAAGAEQCRGVSWVVCPLFMD